MNKIDKQWYKELKFLSKWSVNDAFDILREKNEKKFNKYFRSKTWDKLHSLGYVTSVYNSSCSVVTPTGLEQLRILEDIHMKNLTLIISIIAILLSIFAFAKSMSWI